ncbi:microtubule-associated protein futsch-like isoform X2 [Trachinotus anak]|uniref:microtubule-associated protein futsch-like isoform X2 n=1 Tax=Trachinotus anak TaxID=443729 RepID=UPI0039F1D767
MISMKSGGMKFPVDLLANVGLEELEESAHNYMNNLLYSSPDSPEHLTVSDSTQVTINISSVGFIPLYGFNDKQKILALFSPRDPFIAVALYLLDQWWTVDDILKTADAARDGALEVKTVGERIVLYILNRVIYRAKEMSSEELPFLCHREKDYAKILWSNGEAVGFYSVKPSGSLCNSFSTRTYQLPVMDSTYVRKCQRGKGFGLQMLEDFVLSFKEDCLGLRYPLTKSMYKVCEKYLCQYPGDIDLLWEVESIGAPNQRTNIASKIQAMDLGVSKSLSFTEESLVITEVTEKTAERETLTTQTKEAGSMECTVEIVEEVTVLRATKVSEAEDVAVALRGRSSGSKRRNISEKPQENKSEKVCIKDTVIRIEDIEPETPRQQQVSVHVSELEQTEGMFSVAAEEKGEDVVHTIPEDESVMLDKPATVPLSQDLKEADVIAALMTEVPQVEDDVIQVMKNDSQVIVENVASEIEEAEEECQKEDTEVLVSSEKPLEVHKKAETLDKVGEGTEIKISDEKSEEVITQHELSLSTHTTSEDVEAERTVKTVVEVIKLVQNETHRQSSQQHSKSQDTAQDKGRILRRRTVSNTPTPKCKYTRHSQNICEELEKEVDEEENNGSTEVVEELAVTERKEQEDITSIKEDIVTVGNSPEDEKQQHEDEQLTHEEETKKEEGPERGDSVVKKSSTAQTALKNKEGKITDESGKEQKNEEVETSLIQDKQETSDDEIEESPVVLRRTVRGRHKVSPKPNSRKHSKSYQNQEEHTDQTGLRKGGSAEEKADEQAAEKQKEEHHKVFCESVVIEATIPTVEEAAEDVILSTEMNMEEICKEVQEEKETERETKIVSAADNEEEADGVTGSRTVISDEVRDEAGILGAEGPQDRNIGSEIPKLQKATVILVDFKTTYHHLSVIEAEEKTFDGKCAAPEMEQMELIAAEEKQGSREPEMPMLEEEDQEKQENITENSVDATAEVETVQKEELEENNAEKEKYKSASMDEKQSEAEEAPVLETRVLRSGRKTIDASCKARERSNQQQREDNIGEGTTEKEVAEADAGTVEVEGEMDAVTVIVEEKESVCEDTETDIPIGNYAEEAPVVDTRALRSGTKTVTATPTHKTRRRRKQVDEQEAQNSEARTQRRGRIAISATPKGKSRSTQTNSKQIRKEQQKEEEESRSVEDTRVEEAEIFKEAAVEQTNEEGEEKTEEMGAKVMEAVASEREESLELEMDVQELKVVAEEEQNVEENQSEVTSKTFAEREAEASSENYNDRKPVVGIEEVELPPAAVIRFLRSGGKTSKAPPKARRSRKQEDEEKEEGEVSAEKRSGEEPPVKTRFLSRGGKSVTRSCKQLQEKTVELKESAEEAEVEEQEAVLGSDEEPPTDGDKRKAQEEDGVEVEKGGLVTAEEEVSEKGTMPMTEEENTAGVTAAAGDLVQGETDPALAKPHNDSAVFTPSEEEAILSTEELQSKEKTSLLSDLQSVTVVLVDLKKAHHDIQGETATAEESVLVEKTCDAEEEQKGGIIKEEETVAEGPVPGSPAEIEKTELEKVVLEEEGLEEEVEDLVTIQENTGEGCVEETEAKIVDDEEELKVTEMRKLRSRKYAAKATSRHKSTSRQKQGKKEKKAASEISEDEPVTHVRALGGEGGSIPVAQRCRTRTQKQLQEEKKGGEGREGSTGVEEREAEEEEEYIEEQHTTQEMEKVEYMGVEKADTMAEEAVSQDAPEEEQAGTTETVADENTEAPAKQTAEDRKTSYDVAQETVTTQYAVEEEQSITTSKGAETAAAENAQNTLLITKHDEARGVSDQEEASVSETIILRSGEKAVRAKPRGKATKKQDDEVEVEAAGEKSTEEDEPAVETRVLRKGKRSAPATPRNRSKRARTQCQPEEETEGVTTPAEESEGEETKADENENNSDEKIEEMDDEEFVPQNESFTEQETPSTNKRNITEQEEAPVVEPRVLRSGHKSADTGKPAETRVQRKGRRTAPATPRLKSKRAHTQCQPEQEAEEVTTPSEETEGEEEVAREESPEEKGERAEEGEKWKEMEVEKKDLEEVQVKSAAGGDSVVDTFTEETAVLENEHNSVAAVNETNTDTLQISTAKAEWTNSAEEEESAVIEKSTVATEVGSDTTTAEEEALTEDAYAVTQEEAPVIARALRSKTKTPHATPSGGLKRQKDQGVVDSQQQEDENPEDEKTQEDVHLLTDDIVECREINVMEQAEANETLSTGEETKPLVEDTAEHQAKEKVDLIYNRGLEPKEMESPEESSSGESKEDKTVDPSVEGRNLRRRKKTTNKDGDKVEEIQLPKRRSIRKRPRIDYRENDEEEEGGETEAATDREEEEEVDEDEDEDNRKAECSANEQVEKLEEDNKNENLEKDMGAIESTSEKGDILNLVLDTDEEVETEALSQEHEEDEQNISEEEVEPIVIDKRVLRGRSVPSLIITPHSKPRRHSAKVRKSEESLSDEEKSPQSAQKRSVHKRKSTEVPPTRKAKRHSRV